MLCPHMGMDVLARELKRGSTELLILALLEEHDRHGYELARLIDERSKELMREFGRINAESVRKELDES